VLIKSRANLTDSIALGTLYLSDRDGPAHIFTWDFAKESEIQLTENPVWSPDGKQIAYQ